MLGTAKTQAGTRTVVASGLASGEYVEAAVGPELGDGAGAVVAHVPVGVADRAEEPRYLSVSEPDLGLDPEIGRAHV